MDRVRYWIYDEDGTPMRLPLGKLVQRLREQYPSAHTCLVSRSEGHGESVNTWDDELSNSDEVTVEMTLLQRLCMDGQEWFYEFDAVLPGHGIRFGLHDSTALFIEGDPSSAQALTRVFSDVRPQLSAGV